SRELFGLLLHTPAHVGAEHELHRGVARHCLAQQASILPEVPVVLGEAHLIAIPGKTHVTLLVIEEELQARGGPVLFATMALRAEPSSAGVNPSPTFPARP